jgi:microcystin-dependent protein
MILMAITAGGLFGSAQSAAAQEAFLGEVRLFAGNYPPRGWAFCDGQILQISQNPSLYSILATRFGGDDRITFALPDLRGRVAVHPGKGPGLTARRLGQKGGTEEIQPATQPVAGVTGKPSSWPSEVTLTGHPDNPAYNGVYAKSKQTINKAPVYTRVNPTEGKGSKYHLLYIYLHSAKDNFWCLQPVTPNPDVYQANAYATGKTPWSAKWDPEAVRVVAPVSVTVPSATGTTSIQPFLTANYIICIEGLYPQRN